jgi:hypothetical protein
MWALVVVAHLQVLEDMAVSTQQPDSVAMVPTILIEQILMP